MLETADSTAVTSTSPETGANAVLPLNSPARKMLRTASISARVADLQQVTLQVEDLVQGMHGIVLQSELHNQVEESNVYPYQADSLRKVEVYRPVAHLELRVPAPLLDSAIRSIARWAAFVEHRELKQQDITLTMLANQLKIAASAQSLSHPLPTNARQAVSNATYTDSKREQYIDRKIENLSLDDNVAYAALSVDLFQHPLASATVMVDPVVITRAAFGPALLNALAQGGMMLRGMILLLVQCWPLLLLAAAGFLLYRKRRVFLK